MQTRDRVTAAYDDNYDVLRYIAARQFHVPEPDIRPLIHDVFLRFIRHHASIGDDAGWLVTAVRNACLNYWRDHKPTHQLPLSLADAERADSTTHELIRILAQLDRRCRTILLLRFIHDLSPAEIARRFSPSGSRGYGRILIHRCLKKAREIFARARSAA